MIRKIKASVVLVAVPASVGQIGPSADCSPGTKQAPGSPNHRFIVVAGSGFQGAIVPEHLVPPTWKDGRVAAFWTPQPLDIARLETELQQYLKTALANPSAATPRPLVTGLSGDDRVNLRWLVERLDQFRRQYYGVVWGKEQGIEAFGFVESTTTSEWRDRIIINADGGCGNWYVEFAQARGRIVRFNCQPIGEPRPNPTL